MITEPIDYPYGICLCGELGDLVLLCPAEGCGLVAFI